MNWFPCGQGYEIMAVASPGQTKGNTGGWDGIVPLGTVGGRKTELRLHTVSKKPGTYGKAGCTTDFNEIVVRYS